MSLFHISSVNVAGVGVSAALSQIRSLLRLSLMLLGTHSRLDHHSAHHPQYRQQHLPWSSLLFHFINLLMMGWNCYICQIISCPSENILTVDESLQHGSMWGDHDVMFKEWKLYRRLISNMYSCVQHYISIRDRQINVHVCVRKECINFRLDFATSMCAAVVRIGVKQSDLC